MRISTEISSAADAVGEARAIELVAKAGFDCYDFSMFRMAKYSVAQEKFLFTDHPLHGPDYLKFVRELKRVADGCGISCNQSHAPFPTYREQVVSYLKRAIECTAEVGADLCVIHPDNYKSPQENAVLFASLLPFAKEYGVRIATENMWGWVKEIDQAEPHACATPENFVEHIDLLSDPYLVACLDIGHAEMRGMGTCAVELIHALGKRRLKALHLHDNDKWHDNHALPFTMSIDFKPIVKALKQIGYEGDFTLECSNHLKNLPEEAIPQGLDQMAKAARRLAALFEEA